VAHRILASYTHAGKHAASVKLMEVYYTTVCSSELSHREVGTTYYHHHKLNQLSMQLTSCQDAYSPCYVT